MEKESKQNWISHIFSGGVFRNKTLRENRKLIFYIFLLTFLYIFNSHHAVRISKKYNDTLKELQDIKAVSVTLESELRYNCLQSQVEQLLQKSSKPDIRRNNFAPYLITEDED